MNLAGLTFSFHFISLSPGCVVGGARAAYGGGRWNHDEDEVQNREMQNKCFSLCRGNLNGGGQAVAVPLLWSSSMMLRVQFSHIPRPTNNATMWTVPVAPGLERCAVVVGQSHRCPLRVVWLHVNEGGLWRERWPPQLSVQVNNGFDLLLSGQIDAHVCGKQ